MDRYNEMLKKTAIRLLWLFVIGYALIGIICIIFIQCYKLLLAMANYRLKTNIQRGKFKGKTVAELITDSAGKKYLIALHDNKKYNVKLTEEVLNAIGNCL